MAKKNKWLAKPTHEEIAHRAFSIYEKGDRRPGHDLDDWVEAEAQLIAERRRGIETDQQNNNERTVLWEHVQPAETVMTNHSK